MSGNTVTFLLVEDDAVDVMAVKRAFRRQRIANAIHVASNGEEALELLRAAGDDAFPRPYLILADLNMPRMNGLEFIAELRADPALADSVVYVLTTSEADTDRAEAERLGVVGYGVKSEVGDDFVRVMACIDTLWRYVEFPGGAP